MSQKLMLYTAGVWFLFMFLAIVNAGIREVVYAPRIGDWGGHVVSTVIFIVLIFVVVYLFLTGIQIEYTEKDLLIIGLVWLLATVTFEFLAGHYLFGNSWARLIQDYNLLAGRIWSLVLVSLFSSPYLVDRFLV